MAETFISSDTLFSFILGSSAISPMTKPLYPASVSVDSPSTFKEVRSKPEAIRKTFAEMPTASARLYFGIALNTTKHIAEMPSNDQHTHCGKGKNNAITIPTISGIVSLMNG